MGTEHTPGFPDRADAVDAPTGDAPSLDTRVARLVAGVIAGRARGDIISDEQLVARHPELMPRLGEELEGLRMLQRAYLAAQRAGSIDEPLAPVDVERIDDPIRPAAAPAAGDAVAPFPAIRGYQMLREIRSGGQATVFKALQEATGRKVAVKVLPGGPFAGTRNRTRFDREADILANLDHPNIVGILDRGRTTDGSFYLVMPYVEGMALDAYAADSRSADARFPEGVLRAFVKVARAVQEAHARGVIHRDLKPSNVLVDKRDEPHLLDFGLARLETATTEADWRAHTLTASGQVVGSLPWSSPEQASGDSAKVDGRSDVYSLAVCLYEALTGRLPYPGAGTVKQVLDHIVSTPPLPLGRVRRQLRGVDGDALEAVVMRALDKSPARRHAGMDELAGDLESVLAGRPIVAGPPAPRGWRWRVAVAAGGVAVVCGLFVGGVALWRAGRPPDPAGPPVTVFEQRSEGNTAGMTLIRIPAGLFVMGTNTLSEVRNDDEREHTVRITRPFWLSEREVTLGQYRDVMWGWPAGADVADPDLPATFVSWADACEFCRRLGEREGCKYRLPTEAEWEYACRAGAMAPWSGGGTPDAMGWHAGNAGSALHLPGKLARNHWGLYDMHGNAAEWCLDGYNKIYPSNVNDPLFDPLDAGRVVRGGSYATPSGDTRSAARAYAPVDARRADLGFRVVREMTGPGAASRPSATRPN